MTPRCVSLRSALLLGLEDESGKRPGDIRTGKVSHEVALMYGGKTRKEESKDGGRNSNTGMEREVVE